MPEQDDMAGMTEGVKNFRTRYNELMQWIKDNESLEENRGEDGRKKFLTEIKQRVLLVAPIIVSSLEEELAETAEELSEEIKPVAEQP